MASSQGQNCQRGTVFLCFLIVLFFLIAVIARMVKKLLDPQAEEGAQKYKEGQEEAKKKGEDSALDFDELAKKAPVVAEDDPLTIKLVKKLEELEMTYFPLLILFPLNLITGTAYAFLIVNFFFLVVPLVLFNLLKLHHCTENKCIRVVLENLWLVLLWFMLVNHWGATPLLQPYIVVAG